MANEVKKHKLASLVKQYNDVLDTIPEGETGTYVPQGVRYVPNRVSTSGANRGSTTVTERTDAMGQKVRTVSTKTPFGGAAGGSDFATMEEATAAGNAGQIPANTTVTIGGKPMIWRP